MEDYKIIQIIPVNKEMYAGFKNGAKTLIVGLALIEYNDGFREVVPLDMTDGDGAIRIIDEIFKVSYSNL